MLAPTALLTGMGLVSGLGLAVAAKFFAVEVDPRQEQIADSLPGANCGGCGLAGCSDFASAVVAGKISPADCPVADDETAQLIAEIMGITVEAKDPQVAIVLCQGNIDIAAKKYRYNGLASCASASLLGGGDKGCGQGCLGLADCQRVCGFDAVEMTTEGIAIIIPERCTACGQCITACPKDIIKLIPANSEIHVLCSSHEKGAAAKKNCGTFCLGCKKCEKFYGEIKQIKIDSFLALVDYNNPPTNPEVAEVCPADAIVYLPKDKQTGRRI